MFQESNKCKTELEYWRSKDATRKLSESIINDPNVIFRLEELKAEQVRYGEKLHMYESRKRAMIQSQIDKRKNMQEAGASGTKQMKTE